MTIDDDIDSIKKALKEDTDIVAGIRELFKDSFTDIDKSKLEQHDVDIRTRLIQPEVSSMSVSNFLGSIKMKGLKLSKNLFKKSGYVETSMTQSLSILMWNLKRHKISLEGKSRAEIIDILRGGIERKEQTSGFFRNLFKPKTDNNIR